MRQNNNKKLSIIAYVGVIALLIVLAIFLFKRSAAPKEPEIIGELPQQDWEAQETSVGKIDNIVDNPAEEPVTESETSVSEPLAESEIVSETLPVADTFSETETDHSEGERYAIYGSTGRITNQVEWTNVILQSVTDHEIHYNVASYDVRIMVAGGTVQDYDQQLSDLAKRLDGDIQHEYLSYSPTRVREPYAYDKYTITRMNNDTPSYIYYYISQISDSEVYIVDISSPHEIEDADSFGVLDYAVTPLD